MANKKARLRTLFNIRGNGLNDYKNMFINVTGMCRATGKATCAVPLILTHYQHGAAPGPALKNGFVPALPDMR